MYKKRTFLVGTAGESSAAITGSGFGNGEIGIFKLDGTNVGTTASASEFPLFFAQKQTADLSRGTRKSYVINNAAKITSVRIAGYRAAAPMIKFVGYDGTDGSLSYDCDTDYGIKLTFDSPYVNKYYNKAGGGGLTKTIHIHTDCCTDCTDGCGTAVCYSETMKFVETINSTDKKIVGVAGSVFNFISAELAVDNAANDTVAVWTDASTMTLTQYSKSVTTSAANTLAAGDYIRIGGGNPPTGVDPVYMVYSIESTTAFTLNTPWQGATATKTLDTTLADSDVTKVTVAGVTSCGLKLTGKFISNTTGCCCFPPFPWDVEGVTFIATNSLTAPLPCSVLDVTDYQDLTTGQGTYNQLIYDEMDAYGYSDIREWFKDCAMNVHLPNGGSSYVSYLDSAATYDVIYIDYELPVDSTLPALMTNTQLTLEIACPTAVAGTSGYTASTTTVDTSNNPMLSYAATMTNSFAVLNNSLFTFTIQA